jgi:hypothetical protein
MRVSHHWLDGFFGLKGRFLKPGPTGPGPLAEDSVEPERLFHRGELGERMALTGPICVGCAVSRALGPG